MLLKHLKNQIVKPDKEIFINKWINIRGEDVLLASISKIDDKSILWILAQGYKLGNYEDEEEIIVTNRDEKLRNLERNQEDRHFIIKEMTLGKQIIKFTGSSGTILSSENKSGLFRIYDFIENGVDLDNFNDIDLNNLLLYEYDILGDLNIDKLQLDKLEIIIEKSFVQKYIGKPFISKVGARDINQQISYETKDSNEEINIYINEIYTYDPYQAIEKRIESMKEVNNKEEILSNIFKSLESICPRGKHLAVLSYESSDNLQYEFYTKLFLDKEIEKSNSSRSIGFIGKPDKTLGLNGYKLRECILGTVEKDFIGDVELEVFLKYINIPQLIIKPV